MMVIMCMVLISLFVDILRLNSLQFGSIRNVYEDLMNGTDSIPSDDYVHFTESSLKGLIHLIFLTRITFGYYNRFITSSFLIFYLCVIIVLIINIYLFLTPLDEILYFEIRLLQLRTALVIAAAIQLTISLATHENLHTYECYPNLSKNEDVLSFLFKYPISKLTREEAAQVEMLVATLTLQKPVVKASDTITVGRRLLASISGTVLTYVLVALQFRAAWTKN
ncbi:hypothetical protein JTB14_019563 [Gonioctena quinquepunctata]|nr:hypothetical protein JTB14_019563 [Gonioctena quinquepunctata]